MCQIRYNNFSIETLNPSFGYRRIFNTVMIELWQPRSQSYSGEGEKNEKPQRREIRIFSFSPSPTPICNSPSFR